MPPSDKPTTVCDERAPSPRPDGARRGRWAKAVLAAACLAGAAITVGFVVHIGLGPISRSLARLGPGGFTIFCAYTLAVFGLLGLSWFVIAPDLPLRDLPAFVLARLMREAAADILPFSQMGGSVIAVRLGVLFKAPLAMLTASCIVDLGAEMAGQLLFTALGFAIISSRAPGSFSHPLVDSIFVGGLGVGAVIAVLFVGSQRTGLRLLHRSSARWPAAMASQLSAVQQALKGLYRRPGGTVLSVFLHLIAWIAASGGVWLVLALMSAAIPFPSVVAMESLIYIVRSAAFAVPGAIGVLEGGYVLLGPMFGVPPDVALSLSLIKRGRDLALGLPMVLLWQTLESRQMLARAATAPA